MRVLDLFSGIGGFSLGLERAGMETVAFCEIDKFCQKVLKKHWPDIPIVPNIRSFMGNEFGTVDLICGGFPCQPYSTASRGRKVAECLWSFMLSKIERMRPDYVIAENVQEAPIRKAEKDLKELGYGTTVENIGASDAGANHYRSRWWLCAYPNHQSQFPFALHAEVAKLPQLCENVWSAENYARAIRVPDGIPHRMDRLKCLGNPVLPYIPEIIGKVIMRIENAK